VRANPGGARQPCRNQTKLSAPTFAEHLLLTKGQTSLSLQSVGALPSPFLKQGLTGAEQTMGKQGPSPGLWSPWQVSMALTGTQFWSPKRIIFTVPVFHMQSTAFIVAN